MKFNVEEKNVSDRFEERKMTGAGERRELIQSVCVFQVQHDCLILMRRRTSANSLSHPSFARSLLPPSHSPSLFHSHSCLSLHFFAHLPHHCVCVCVYSPFVQSRLLGEEEECGGERR